MILKWALVASRFITVLTRARHPPQSSTKWFQYTRPQSVFQALFSIILSTSWSSEWRLPCRFPNQNSELYFLSPRFTVLIICGETLLITELLVVRFIKSCVNLTLRGINFLLRTLVLNVHTAWRTCPGTSVPFEQSWNRRSSHSLSKFWFYTQEVVRRSRPCDTSVFILTGVAFNLT